MIPREMQELPFWLPWKAEWKVNAKGVGSWNKIPYDLRTGRRGSVLDESMWHPLSVVLKVLTENPGWYNGLGFALTDLHRISGVDLDNVYKGRDPNNPADQQAAQADWNSHNEIVRELDSYTEWSPSGSGLRIFVEGKIPQGYRNRAGLIEVYSRERFLTVTGKSFHPTPKPLVLAQSKLIELSKRLGEVSLDHTEYRDGPQLADDDVVLQAIINAKNGEAFMRLWAGDGSKYPSASEADQALANYIGFFTDNHEQAKRIFRLSDWYKNREKLNNGGRHADKLLDLAVQKSFDQKTPHIDIEAMTARLSQLVEGRAPEIAPSLKIENPRQRWEINTKPPGVVGDVAEFIYQNSARPNRAIALAGAIGFIAGIAGKAYNFMGNGLNQYICVLADSGQGKDAIPKAWSRLFHECSNEHHSITQFSGPRDYASGPAMYKYIAQPINACTVSYFPEFGHQIGQLNDPRSPPHIRAKLTAILDLWTKSAATDIVEASVYSDKENNTIAVKAPSLSFVGDSTFGTFFEDVSAQSIANGFIPRMLLVPVYDLRPPFNIPGEAVITTELRAAILALAKQAQTNMASKLVTQVQCDADAYAFLSEFNTFCDQRINYHSPTEGHKAMWARAYQKCLKLAGLLAVGENPFAPTVSLAHAQYAKSFVYSDVNLLIGRFDTGLQETGAPTTDIENRLLSLIKQWLQNPGVVTKYNINEKLYAARFIEKSYLQRRTAATSLFKKYQGGATRALKDGIQQLLDRGTLVEVAPGQVHTVTDGGKMVAYAIGDPTAISTAADLGE